MDAVDKIIEQWKTEGFDANELIAMESLGRIKRLDATVGKKIRDNFQKNYHLEHWEFDVLATLRRAGEPYCLSPTALFDSMMISSGAMTNRLKKLEKKSLIVRISNPDDKRSTLVKLSGEGLARVNEVITSHITLTNQLTSGLNDEELKIMNVLLKKMANTQS